jgi:hypothetical protein
VPPRTGGTLIKPETKQGNANAAGTRKHHRQRQKKTNTEGKKKPQFDNDK